MNPLDIGGDLMRCTAEQAEQVCEQLLAAGFRKKGLPITGVGHGPRAHFRWLRKEPLAVFTRHFDSFLTAVGGRRSRFFEQVVVVRALLLLNCNVKRYMEGCRRKEYVTRLVRQRPSPTSEEAALQQAVEQASQSKDYTPCLVYADWLEEHGQTYLADRFRNIKVEAPA